MIILHFTFLSEYKLVYFTSKRKFVYAYDIVGICGTISNESIKTKNYILSISCQKIYSKNYYINEGRINDCNHIRQENLARFQEIYRYLQFFSSNTEINVLLFTCHVEDFMKQRISPNTSSIPAYKLSIFMQTLLALFLMLVFC